MPFWSWNFREDWFILKQIKCSHSYYFSQRRMARSVTSLITAKSITQHHPVPLHCDVQVHGAGTVWERQVPLHHPADSDADSDADEHWSGEEWGVPVLHQGWVLYYRPLIFARYMWWLEISHAVLGSRGTASFANVCAGRAKLNLNIPCLIHALPLSATRWSCWMPWSQEVDLWHDVIELPRAQQSAAVHSACESGGTQWQGKFLDLCSEFTVNLLQWILLCQWIHCEFCQWIHCESRLVDSPVNLH